MTANNDETICNVVASQQAEGKSADQIWRQLLESTKLSDLTPPQKYELWKIVFADWDTQRLGPAPMWLPTDKVIESANLTALMRETNYASLNSLTDWWQRSPAEFWRSVIERLEIKFREPPSSILAGDDMRQPEWLSGARLNIVESCFQADENAIAIRSGNSDGMIVDLTYEQLRDRVHNVATSLRATGFQPGSRIAIVMPMTADAVAIYLGILWAGCAAVSIADSFAAKEIGRRMEISHSAGVVCCDSFVRAGKTIDVYSRICSAAQARAIVLPSKTLAAATLRDGDLSWSKFLQRGTLENDPQQSLPYVAGADHMINILFSSGTTGEPKAIPWDQTTPIKCAADGMFHQDIKPGDVVVWPTNLGWMMGPWLIFAALINRATIGLFEDAPVGKRFGQFVEAAQVTMLGVVPTLVRAWRESGCMEAFVWSVIRCFSSTGEASNADDMFYLSSLADFRPVIEYCGGTEIGGGYISSTVIQPNAPGVFSTAAIGNAFEILDADGRLANVGELFLVPPAIGLSRRLLNRDHHETYYRDVPISPTGRLLRRHGDHFRRLSGGYFAAGGRVDDTMNISGIKVSSAEIEQIINQQTGIRESAAIGRPAGESGPDRLVVFVVLEKNDDERALARTNRGDDDVSVLLKRLNQALREELNPLIMIAEVCVIPKLPRTASNKIIRRELRSYPKTI